MAATLLVLSKNPEDIAFGQRLAKKNGFQYEQGPPLLKLKNFLVDHPHTLVLLNGDETEDTVQSSLILEHEVPSHRVFIITDQPLNRYPALFRHPCFNHHIHRRFEHSKVYERLASAAFIPVPFGLKTYFPEKTQIQKIQITQSSQKTMAVEALQKVLEKNAIASRLAAIVAQATDELLLNALFDAPVNANGRPYKKLLDRKINFNLNEREKIELQFAVTPDYVGVSVADQFGSLEKDVLLSFLRQDFSGKPFHAKGPEGSSGLGIHGIIQTGISLLFVSKPGTRTEVMLFFPNTPSFKEFREGFRFLGILAP